MEFPIEGLIHFSGRRPSVGSTAKVHVHCWLVPNFGMRRIGIPQALMWVCRIGASGTVAIEGKLESIKLLRPRCAGKGVGIEAVIGA